MPDSPKRVPVETAILLELERLRREQARAWDRGDYDGSNLQGSVAQEIDRVRRDIQSGESETQSVEQVQVLTQYFPQFFEGEVRVQVTTTISLHYGRPSIPTFVSRTSLSTWGSAPPSSSVAALSAHIPDGYGARPRCTVSGPGGSSYRNHSSGIKSTATNPAAISEETSRRLVREIRGRRRELPVGRMPRVAFRFVMRFPGYRDMQSACRHDLVERINSSRYGSLFLVRDFVEWAMVEVEEAASRLTRSAGYLLKK